MCNISNKENIVPQYLSQISSILSLYDNLHGILIGSCSRNEESYCKLDKYYLISDLEFFVIYNDKNVLEDLDKKLKQLNKVLKSENPFSSFFLDWSYIHKKKLRFSDRRFILYEAIQSAKVFHGDRNIIKLYPNINIRNLNYSELDDIIIHRFYHVYRDWGLSDNKYLIARNTLDILTLYLPYNGYLCCGYARRNEVYYNFLEQDKRIFVSDFSSYLNYKIDRIGLDNFDEYEMLTIFIKDFEVLVNYLIERQGNPFLKDYRFIASSLLRFKPSKIKMSLFKDKQCNELYSILQDRLKQLNINHEFDESIGNKMEELYGYK